MAVYIVALLFYLPLFSKDIKLHSITHFKHYAKLIQYNIDSQQIPPLFSSNIPDDMSLQRGKRKINTFIKIVLPLILRENKKLSDLHKKIEKIFEQSSFSAKDLDFIDKITKKYNILSRKNLFHTIPFTEYQNIKTRLLYKIRPIPPAIAIAMAALESGWGTSRFVVEGNNIFGHVAKNPSNGLKPKRWSGNKRHIKIFSNLSESIEKYMLNLNRNRAYSKFRYLRDQYPDDAVKIAEAFLKYSIIRDKYIKRLKKVITKFNLIRFNDVQLHENFSILNIDQISSIYLQ